MSKKFVATICLTLLSAAPSALAEDTPTISGTATTSDTNFDYARNRQISMSDCFTKADAENREIKVAAADLPIAQANKVIAAAIPNPTYSLTYGFGPAWQYIVAGNNQQFGWTEEILVAGKRTKRVNVANANYMHSLFQLEATRFDVHNRVFRAYVELAAANAYAKLTEDQRDIAAQLLTISQKRFDAGKAPRSEVLQAKLAFQQFAVQRNQAQARLVQDSVQLAQLLGETPHRQEIIAADENGLFRLAAGKNMMLPDPEAPQLVLEELLPTAWKERKDLKAAIQQAYSNKRAVTLAKSARIPDPTVGFDYLFTTYKTHQVQYFDPTGTGVPSNANKVPEQPGYLITYAQEAPIFYQYQGQVQQAKANLALQEKQNDLLRAQIASSILSSYEAMTVASDNVRKYKTDLLPASAKVAQLTRRGYELGKTELSAAILAQQQYQQTRSSYFDAVVAYQNAWADLEKSVGVPLKL